jgi:AraC-like DNA-binding protein
MLRFDRPFLDTFSAVEIRTEDLDLNGRFARNIAVVNDRMSFRLRDGLGRLPGETMVSLQSMRHEGALQPCYNVDVFGTDIRIIGAGQPELFGLIVVLSGAMDMVAGPNGSGTGSAGTGLALRGSPGTRVLTTDDSIRLSLWFDAPRTESVLATLIGATPTRPLAFAPTLDWARPGPRRIMRLVEHLIAEMHDPEGLTTEPVARETFTDLFLQSLLLGLDHNHRATVARPNSPAIPAHLRRAEALMHAAADRPLALAEIAAAAGCSLGALQSAFRRFRDTTLLGALRDIRLEHAREALLAAEPHQSTRQIARRFGFTNPSRFIAAYGRRFGERPLETRARNGR